MQVSEILHTLPTTLEWMVLFNLSAISKMADDATMRDMYHLPKEINLESYSHVVLTSQGRFLAPHDESKLIEPFSGNSWSREQIKTSLYDRFASQLALFSVDEADCLGLGEIHPRYQCQDHCEYIAKFALPTYVSKGCELLPNRPFAVRAASPSGEGIPAC